MNKKQVVCMWCGIVVIVFVAFVKEVVHYTFNLAAFCVWVFLIALVTAGLIITFKDKKGKEGEARKPMNVKRGFQRITLILAILVGVICGCAVIGILMDIRGLAPIQMHRRGYADASWIMLSTNKFVGLLVLAGLGSAIAGFCGVWLSYFLVGPVYELIKWLKLGFRIDTG